MTVKTLHTFTDAEMSMIASCLRIGRDHFRSLAREMPKVGAVNLEQDYYEFANKADELSLTIESGQTDSEPEPSAHDIKRAFANINRAMDAMGYYPL